METRKIPSRRDGRVIIHFDYDCFYAAVFEAKNPSLKSLPFAVQQKHIIVTCNYEARRRGLYKLQLIRDARRMCPDVIIELGEDISKFRDASKELYTFLKAYSWNGKVERLGFDEVWLDVTDMVDYNMQTLNRNHLGQSFFQTSHDDPMDGFSFDASNLASHAYPANYAHNQDASLDDLTLRLRLGSHLALHMRHQLEQQKGYTSTVGIATSKLLSKLVGNLNKPKGQTTLMPPLETTAQTFMDGHDIGKVPGIGFKLAQKLREFVLQRPADFDSGLVYGGTKENVTVAAVRNHPAINPETLEKLLGGPGSPHGIGFKIWCLLHGVDDMEVNQAKVVPSQISIEDSYIRLDTMPELLRELTALGRSLITRMRIDLLGEDDYDDVGDDGLGSTDRVSMPLANKKWLAHPKTLRLTTRPRQPLQQDGTRARSFKRISHSAPLPTFIFGLSESIESLADRLVKEALLGMFRRLHPEKSGWNLSLVNLAVTNMAETAGDSKTANGRDIGNMFKRQDDVLKDFRIVNDEPLMVDAVEGSDEMTSEWDDGDDEHDSLELCRECGARLPGFAMIAHRRFHTPTI
ncbi:hypothetical protein BAUCODRAFT_91554 [Baudoinia panamericana UAMH 10762]|uniref:UmuC domain-containing protein n=1 Tax=Baudoinia panamericana (strain UAMH 10762) TaxID=717646 RepID=M2N7I6_BAUPA|nr:uncharacterized protein BAUCODRAFT_91554 [Baudoinia panamericana UAMH 10762]EMC95019.1 hypothetical protein BAUCODRAFT_91554 [Baudoinia panamericana UAMH 10762]